MKWRQTFAREKRDMKNRCIPLIMKLMSSGMVLLVIAWNTYCMAEGEPSDVWKSKENLIRRLAAEWYKVGLLQKDFEALQDILTTMRDLELYPVELTGLDDRHVVAFDRSLEGLQKSGRALGSRIDGYVPQVNDALRIVREMVIDEPVESMFETLEQGNLRRIDEMMLVKHEIDTLWMRTDSLLGSVMRAGGMPEERRADSGAMENEFFRLIKVNPGMQSAGYFGRYAQMKKRYMSKASAAQIDQMIQVDMKSVENCVSGQKIQLAEKRINDMLEYYAASPVSGRLYAMLAKVKLMRGQYREVLETLGKIPATPEYRRILTMYRIQSLYALQEYASIMADTAGGGLFELTGKDLNCAVWILIECGLALRIPEAGRQFVRLMNREHPFALHIMHALSRSFLAQGDDSTALSILNEALRIKPVTENDRIALAEIRNAIAVLYYEQENYQKAVELFYQQLNVSGMFEHALFGIVWCYLKTGSYTKAETALRKLINQSPESAVGAEGILTLARRYLQAAQQSWDKQMYLEKERERLESLLKRITEMEKTETDKAKFGALSGARTRLREMIDGINKEKVADHAAIMAHYSNIDKLCTFIASHYYTGTYQETYFSKSREHVLAIVDSALAEMADEKGREAAVAIVSNAKASRLRIKKTVDDAAIFSVVSLIGEQKWENEFIDLRKRQIRRANAQNSSDTAGTGIKKDVLTATYKKSLDSLLDAEQAINEKHTARLKLRISRLLSGVVDTAQQCYLNYQLGELCYREENSMYARQYELYEKLMDKSKNSNGSSGGSPEKDTAPPVLDHEKSMRYYRAAIKSSPLSLFAGASTYCLAWCFNDAGKFDSAYFYMNSVARQYPDNPHTAQAWMFCGEYLFDSGNLEKALESFTMVMKYPESEWFDEALYKVAWTQYRMSNPQKAISSFLALVDLGQGAMGKSILEKESMDYIAISFSEIDVSGQKGLQRAITFAKKLGDKKRGSQILYRLARVYREQGRYEMAQKAYSVLLTTFPDYEMNPQVEVEMLMVQDNGATTETLLERKYDYFKKYNRKGSWAQKQTDSIMSNADSVSANMLYDAAVGYHQLALQESGGANYQNAVKAYADYISFYQTSPLANECHYNLAEIQFSLGNYLDAAEEFMIVSQRYPESKYRETAAWNAIVAAQNILKAETAAKKQEKQ